MKQHGFAMIIVLAVVALLMSGVLTCVQLSQFYADIGAERVCWVRRFYLTERALACGVQLAQKGWDHLLTARERLPLEISLAQTLGIGNAKIVSHLAIVEGSTEKSNAVMVSAFLYESGTLVHQQRCRIIKQDTGLMHVQKPHFLIQYFTVGTGV